MNRPGMYEGLQVIGLALMCRSCRHCVPVDDGRTAGCAKAVTDAGYTLTCVEARGDGPRAVCGPTARLYERQQGASQPACDTAVAWPMSHWSRPNHTEETMAAKIPVNVHIGVTELNAPLGHDHDTTRVTITGQSGESQVGYIAHGQAPEQDAGGNLAYTVGFTGVQSGEDLHVEVKALDGAGEALGLVVTHEAHIDEVPDEPGQTYYAPQSIYISV